MLTPTPHAAQPDRLVAGLIAILAGHVPAQEPAQPAARSTIEAGVFVSHYANGVVRETGRVDAEGQRTGPWRLNWPNGRPAKEGTYTEGQCSHWQLFDPYGRRTRSVAGPTDGAEERVLYESQVLPPLIVGDLRVGLVGLTTVGALVDRFARAEAGSAGDATRNEVSLALATAPPEALGVPFSIAAQMPPDRRVPWLQLMAAMPMPPHPPYEEVAAWLDEPECAAAADALLTRWSLAHRAAWEPLLTSGHAGRANSFELGRLGPGAWATLPELRRQFVASDFHSCHPDSLLSIVGAGAQSTGRLWLEDLDAADAGRRAMALGVLTAMAGRGFEAPTRVPLVRIVELLADPCPAVAHAAFRFAMSSRHLPADAFDDALAVFASCAYEPARRFAVDRRIALGRWDEVEPQLRDLAVRDPRAMQGLGYWNLLVEHTTDPASVRALLLDQFARGNVDVINPLQRVAGDDEATFALLRQQHAATGWTGSDALWPPQMLVRWREHLLDALKRDELPAQHRVRTLLHLLSRDDDIARRAIAHSLAAPDAQLRLTALRGAAACGYAPSEAQWRSLLVDPATSKEAGTLRVKFPVTGELDLQHLPYDAALVAYWAKGRPERIAELIERFVAGELRIFDVLVVLDVDLREVEQRLAKAQPGFALADPMFRVKMPMLEAEARIRRLLGDRTVICPGPELPVQQPSPAPPADAALLDAVRRRLLATVPEPRQEALRLLAKLGSGARPLLATIEQVLPTLSPVEASRFAVAVYAIAPDAVLRICEPLLDHEDAEVVQTIVTGPTALLRSTSGGLQTRDEIVPIPDGAAFAQRIATHLARHPDALPSAWFTALERGNAALPQLRTGLREHPRSAALTTAIGHLGPAAAAAVPELLLALGMNRASSAALAAVLPPRELAHRLLPLLWTERRSSVIAALGDHRYDDADDLAVLEGLARHQDEPTRSAALELLACSTSESAAADAARRAFLDRPPLQIRRIAFTHWDRLWPRLTEAERDAVFGAVMYGSVQLPPNVAAALASRIAKRGPDELFQRMLSGAPLHPSVVERVAATTAFWNPPVDRSVFDLTHQHLHAVLVAWLECSVQDRALAVDFMRQHAAQLLIAARSWTSATQPRFDTPQFVELLKAVGPALTERDFAWMLTDSHLEVRRAALREFVAGRRAREDVVRCVAAALRDGIWHEHFGPLEDMPPVCAEIAAAMPPHSDPTVERRLAALAPRLDLRHVDSCPSALTQLRHLGTAGAPLLPAIEALATIPWLHFEVVATARVLRGEVPAEAPPPRPKSWWTNPNTTTPDAPARPRYR